VDRRGGEHMSPPVFASSHIITAMATSGLTGGVLQCIYVDAAVLILDVTNEEGVSIVEPVSAPDWAAGGEPMEMPWRSISSDDFDRWKDNEYRNFRGVDLRLDINQDDSMPRALISFEGLKSAAVIVDNTHQDRKVQSFAKLTEPVPRSQSDSDGGLAGRFVVIIGSGSLGSHLARALAEWGLRKFLLVDKDWLEGENLALHACDPRWVGAAKAKAVAADLERIKGTAASGWRFDVLEQTEITRDLIAAADFVVVAVDDRTTRAWLNHTSVALGVPTLFAALYRAGTIGESLLVTPGGPCLNCSRMILPVEINMEKEETPSAYRNGLLTSIYGLSSLVAGMVASTLAPDVRGAGPLRAPLALWSPIAQQDLDAPFRFDLPNQTTWVPLPSEISCAVCRGGNSPPAEEAKDRMSERLGISG
jgi:molybdopterin/thiamine biosynthesis adenylyltransferase